MKTRIKNSFRVCKIGHKEVWFKNKTKPKEITIDGNNISLLAFFTMYIAYKCIPSYVDYYEVNITQIQDLYLYEHDLYDKEN